MGMVAQALKEKPQDVVVFMVGGVTYEESKFVAGVNESLSGVRIVLGGTGVVNSLMFLKVCLPLVMCRFMLPHGFPDCLFAVCCLMFDV
jgi:Sec1 family